LNQRTIRAGAYIAAISLLAAISAYFLLKTAAFTVAIGLLAVIGVFLLLQPLVGLCASLGVIYLQPQTIFPVLSGLHLMLLIGAATFASMLIRRAVAERVSPFSRAPQDYLMLWLLLAVVASHLSHLETSRLLSTAPIFLKLLVIYLLLTNLVTTKRRLHLVLYVLVALTVILALQGLYQSWRGGGLFEYQSFREDRAWGIGRFRNPNMLAIALVCASPFAYLGLLMDRSRGSRIAMILVILVLLAALYVTNSRGGVLAWGVVTSVILARRVGPLRSVLVVGSLAAVIFLLGPSRMATISPYEESAYGRLVAWDAALDALRSHPVFGIGADAWVSTYHSLIPHNSYLHCAAELGLFGLVPWVLLVLVSVRNVFYVIRQSRDPELRLLAESILMSLIGFIVASMFISKPYHELLFILFGLCVAVTNLFLNVRSERYKLFERSDMYMGLAVSIVGLLGFRLFLSLFRL